MFSGGICLFMVVILSKSEVLVTFSQKRKNKCKKKTEAKYKTYACHITSIRGFERSQQQLFKYKKSFV